MKTIAEHVLDIVQNSIRAKATVIEIIVEESQKNDIYSLRIKDNGCGMNKEMLQKATDPFFTSRTTRKVGLGLALLKQNAERSNGSFQLFSEPNNGTVVKADFQLSNIDRPPLGDIWNAWYLTVISHENVELNYKHLTKSGTFEIRTAEIKKLMGSVSLKQKEMREAVLEMFRNNLEEIESTF